jgi:hypothetical protein
VVIASPMGVGETAGVVHRPPSRRDGGTAIGASFFRWPTITTFESRATRSAWAPPRALLERA